MRVALASCQTLPEPDPDEERLLEALRSSDIDAHVLPWDGDTPAAFADHDVVVLRSTWNYYERLDDFLAWTQRVGGQTRLLNPAGIVAWNARKTYLRDLHARGIAVVPTDYVGRGERCELAQLVSRRGWDRFVIKPTVSAGSFRTAAFEGQTLAAAQRFLDELAADRDAMVQAWMPSVKEHGERSLVWIDGELTHAVRKSPRFAGGTEETSGPMPISDEEDRFARDVLVAATRDRVAEDSLLYARVDVVRDGDVLRVMELELIEPSLFLLYSDAALARLVAGIRARG